MLSSMKKSLFTEGCVVTPFEVTKNDAQGITFVITLRRWGQPGAARDSQDQKCTRTLPNNFLNNQSPLLM